MIATTNKLVNVCGIDNHEVCDIPTIVTCAGIIQTQRGPAIAIMHNYAYTGKGRTIHSSPQLEFFKNDVNNQSVRTLVASSRSPPCVATPSPSPFDKASLTSPFAPTLTKSGPIFPTSSSLENLSGILPSSTAMLTPSTPQTNPFRNSNPAPLTTLATTACMTAST